MKPSPTLHRFSTDPSKVSLCDAIVSGYGADPVGTRTYSHRVEVPFELLGNLMGELAARDRQAVPSRVQDMNLPSPS